jgi:hypothetical protein
MAAATWNSLIKYRSAPIPFRDFFYGFPLRLGRGGTSSNRRDQQRSIQIFSASGVYNAAGVPIAYPYTAEGDPAGYAEDPADLPYEPPKTEIFGVRPRPSASLARLFMGGRNGFEWPDFNALERLHIHLLAGDRFIAAVPQAPVS